MMGQFLGLLFILGGCSLFYWSALLVEMFGQIDRAVRYVNSTKNFYRILGFIIVIGGFLLLFGFISFTSVSDTDSMNYNGL